LQRNSLEFRPPTFNNRWVCRSCSKNLFGLDSGRLLRKLAKDIGGDVRSRLLAR
jgi:hypothetical protein